jgi:tRNA threonylcarbamoyladenosine biosynthesis protein TsaB
MTILNIETSSLNCSVAIAIDGEPLFEREKYEERYIHAEVLPVFIDEVLRECKSPIDAVAVSSGPGSYTGLRIGVSTAKGLCIGWNCRLIAVPVTDHMTEAIRVSHPGFDFYIPLIDARRMEVYTAVYNDEGACVAPVHACIVELKHFEQWLKAGKVCFFGDASIKTESEINHANATFVHQAIPSAKDLAKVANRHALENRFVDVAQFEPFYLKDFIAGSPKKML